MADTRAIKPSEAHLCDLARARRREHTMKLQEAMRHRDICLNKSPADMARAVQHQAMIAISEREVALMDQITEESCGF